MHGSATLNVPSLLMIAVVFTPLLGASVLYNSDMVLYYMKHSMPNRDASECLMFSVNLFRFEQLMMGMANRGEWRPAL